MLRFLHTADWHLGQTLRGYSRELEHVAVLDELVAIVEQHRPHALLVAGDIFDSPNPPPEAQRLFFRTLVRLHAACPSMSIVLTAGNHDAASRLEAPRDLFAAFGVHVVGNVRRHSGRTLAAPHLIPLPSPEGELLGHVLAVSYPTAACLPAVAADATRSRLIAAVQQLYADLLEQTRSQWQGLPLILTGHLHVSGAQQSEGSERPILIGGENAFPANLFPAEASYLALGHLHKPQRAGADHIRYSGSLLPLSASEIDYAHGVTLVEIHKKKVSTQHIALARPLGFHRIPNKGFALLSKIPELLAALKLPKNPPKDQRPFAQIRLCREGLSPAFREELDNLAEAHGLRLVDTRIEDLEPSTITNDAQAPVMQTVAQCDPVHFFRLAYASTFSQQPSPAHLAVFEQVLEEVQAQ